MDQTFESRKCSSCMRYKSTVWFKGSDNNCTTCRSMINKRNYLNRLGRRDEGFKYCKQCANLKEMTFFKDKSKVCMECDGSHAQELKLSASNKLELILGNDVKICRTCKVGKNKNSFRAGRQRCKTCNNKSDAQIAREKKDLKNDQSLAKVSVSY